MNSLFLTFTDTIWFVLCGDSTSPKKKSVLARFCCSWRWFVHFPKEKPSSFEQTMSRTVLLTQSSLRPIIFFGDTPSSHSRTLFPFLFPFRFPCFQPSEFISSDDPALHLWCFTENTVPSAEKNIRESDRVARADCLNPLFLAVVVNLPLSQPPLPRFLLLETSSSLTSLYFAVRVTSTISELRVNLTFRVVK